MGLAPAPQFPENDRNLYQRTIAPNAPGQQGPLRFEEGIATDTDVPQDFVRGFSEAAIPAPGRSNHVNPNVQYKHADETMRERAHVGSASWPEAPSLVASFAQGTMTEAYSEQRYEQIDRSGGRYERQAPSIVED